MYPILFNFGPITIRTYGVVIAVSILLTFLLLYKEAKRRKFYPDKIVDLVLIIILSGLIGARILHILVNFNFYRKNLFDMFLIWRGGLAFYGALIFVVSASIAFIIKNKMPFWKTVDLIAPYAALGHSIGRIGCFLNGCCFGKYIGDTLYRYPTQIYASFSLLTIFIILRLAQRRSPFSGFVFGLYLILYSFQRFFIDFLRGDNPTYILGLTVSQIISIVIFIIVSFLFLLKTRRKDVG